MTIKDKLKAVLIDVKANFEAAAILYSMLGDNENLKEKFKRKAKRKKQDVRSILKLRHCLEKILNHLPLHDQQVAEDKFAPKIILKSTIKQTVSSTVNDKWIPSDAPAPLQKLKEKYQLLAREEIQLFGRLFPEVGLSEKQCYEIQAKIYVIKKKQDEIGDAVRKWKATGELPIVKNNDFQEGVKAYKRLMNLRTRPKKLQKQADTAATEEERQKYLTVLNNILKEITYLERQIKAN